MAKRNGRPPEKGASKPRLQPDTARTGGGNGLWLYGFHPVLAALKNPERRIFRLLATKETAAEIPPSLLPSGNAPEPASRSDIDALLPKGVVHQGIAACVSPLPGRHVEDIASDGRAVVVLLDQVTDPHNVGAVLRSAAAFDAKAVITTGDNAPEATGTIAKSACGALETVPLIAVSNLARAMKTLKDMGFWCVGMDGKAEKALHESKLPERIALVMGSEGYGLRRLTAENCDFMVKLPISEKMESLNVSNAAAIALYDLRLRE
ncbi:MAG: 23S rRNA (guanosine(2251)-2'-O)-methyltransferase RlmB [Alphaproteobacteria bacterium]|mgnify:CR=1 FL=1|jgi:23S rRNA (guanosine2251-2'-O)-methyltransferase